MQKLSYALLGPRFARAFLVVTILFFTSLPTTLLGQGDSQRTRVKEQDRLYNLVGLEKPKSKTPASQSSSSDLRLKSKGAGTYLGTPPLLGQYLSEAERESDLRLQLRSRYENASSSYRQLPLGLDYSCGGRGKVYTKKDKSVAVIESDRERESLDRYSDLDLWGKIGRHFDWEYAAWTDTFTTEFWSPSRGAALPLFIGLSAIAVQNQDDDVRDFFNDEEPLGGTNQEFDDIFAYTLAFGSLGTAIFNPDKKGGRARDLEVFGETMGLTIGITETLKVSVDRERPDLSDGNSFPSGHTAISFAAATYLSRKYEDWRITALGYSMATIVGLSRMDNDKHFASDVLAGAGIGMLSAQLIYSWHYNEDGVFGRKVLVAPYINEDSTGLALSMRF